MPRAQRVQPGALLAVELGEEGRGGLAAAHDAGDEFAFQVPAVALVGKDAFEDALQFGGDEGQVLDLEAVGGGDAGGLAQGVPDAGDQAFRVVADGGDPADEALEVAMVVGRQVFRGAGAGAGARGRARRSRAVM